MPIRLLLASACALALASCSSQAPEDLEPEPDLLAAAERDLVPTTCLPEASPYAGVCSQAGTLNAASFRVGATSTSRGELAQTFVAPRAGLPGVVRVSLRALRRVEVGVQPILRVALREASDLDGAGAGDLAAGEALWSSDHPDEYAIALSPVNPASPVQLVEGTAYALVFSVDQPSSGTLLFGLLTHFASPFVDGAIWKRSLRRATATGPFAVSRFRADQVAADLSFSLSYGEPATLLPPELVLTSPQDGAVYPAGSTVTLAFTATGPRPLVSVSLAVSGAISITSMQAVNALGPYTNAFTFDVPPSAAEGDTFTVALTVLDAADTLGPPQEVTVTQTYEVDSTPPTHCYIAGIPYSNGETNPEAECQRCDPLTPTAWSNEEFATGCAVGAGSGICDGAGSCMPACFIDGLAWVEGTANPDNACEVCAPGTSAGSWSPRPVGFACGSAGVCLAATCVAGCEVGGAVHAAWSANPANECEVCRPELDRTAWSSAEDGVACDGGAASCVAGACSGAASAGLAVVAASSPAGLVTGGCAVLEYSLQHTTGARGDVRVEFDDGSGTWRRATQGPALAGTEGVRARPASLAGSPHRFVWNTSRDLGARNVEGVRVRFTAEHAGQPGASALVAGLTVQNGVALELEPAQELSPTSNGAWSSALRDLTGDGVLDYLAPKINGHLVIVRAGQGDGTFGPALEVPVVADPRFLAFADYDRDGHLDVATAGAGSSAISVLLFDAAGTPTRVDTGGLGTGHPSSLATGDFDCDGRADLVVSFDTASRLAFLRGLGDGTFAAPVSYALASAYAHLGVGDFDRDGLLDVVAVGFTPSVLSLSKGTGLPAAPFAARVDRALADFGPDAAPVVADLDGDGLLDVASRSTSGVLFVSRGDGTFFEPTLALEDGEAGGNGSAVAFDFDGDGRLDLATADGRTRGVRVFRNEGAFSFSQVASRLTGLEITSLAGGDLDRDGAPDLVVSSANDNQLRVVRNRRVARCGAGFDALNAYGSSLTRDLGINISYFELGDLDDDGRPDVVATCDGGSSVVSFPGRGDGSFEYDEGRIVPTLASPAGGGRLADYDEDGDLDVLVGTNNSFEVALHRNDGSGVLGEAETFASSIKSVAVAAGDLNGDGHLDAVFARLEAPTLVVFTGDGAGQFTEGTTYALGGNGDALDLRDLDGNGTLDVIARTYGQAAILLGHGDATFEPATTWAMPGNHTSLALADFDEDGFLDLAAAGWNATIARVRLNAGDGTFPSALDLETGSEPMQAVAGDLDGDGHADLLVLSQSEGTTDTTFLGNGDGTFGPAVSRRQSRIAPRAVLADVDEDGVLDLLDKEYGVGVVLGLGAGHFRAQLESATFPLGLVQLVVADLDRDGVGDAITVPENDPSFDVSLGTGDGHWGAPTTLATGGSCSSDPCATLAVADVDRDGDLDVVTGGDTTTLLSVHLNDGSGGFGPATTTELGVPPASLVLVDLDRDGDQDVVAAVAGVASLVVTRNDGTGGFGAPELFDACVQARLSVGDFDRDGWPDVAVACPDQGDGSAVRVLPNDGAGGLDDTLAPIVSPESPSRIFAVDLDRDGDLDLVTGGEQALHITGFMNDGAGAFTNLNDWVNGNNYRLFDVADFTGDGWADVVTMDGGNAELHLLANDGVGGLLSPTTAFRDEASPGDAKVADVNLDGVPDLVVLSRDWRRLQTVLGR